MPSEEADSTPNLQRLMGRINYERQVFPSAGELKLDWLRVLLERLGHPQLAVPTVHVAGTKGKGSTTRMIADIAQAAGLSTGTYTSPHIERFNERICLNGEPVSDSLLERKLAELWPEVEQVDRMAEGQSRRSLTFFDIASTLAFTVFAEARPDLVVLETGLGGRLDSTNVCQPVLSVITSISLDHCRQLGNTVEAIAGEKAGIIKRGIPVINGVPLTSPACNVIAAVARLQGSQLLQRGPDFRVRKVELQPGRTRFSCEGVSLRGEAWELEGAEVKLLGKHSADNAALAVAAGHCLREILGAPIRELDFREALGFTRLTGRIETVNREPLIVLDVAHNPVAAAALAETLQDQVPEWKAADQRILVLAVSRDKDEAGILKHLLPIVDRVICTRYCENPRAADPEILAGAVLEAASQLDARGPQAIAVETAATPELAWRRAMKVAGPNSAIAITGSFFLIAELRQQVLQFVNMRQRQTSIGSCSKAAPLNAESGQFREDPS